MGEIAVRVTEEREAKLLSVPVCAVFLAARGQLRCWGKASLDADMEWRVCFRGPVSLTIELNRPLSWDVPRAVNWALALWALATAFKECWDHPKPNRGSRGLSTSGDGVHGNSFEGIEVPTVKAGLRAF